MGQLVLSSQFVAGLVPELKTEVAGFEGSLERLLTRTRFEEAKIRDLTEAKIKSQLGPQNRAVTALIR